MAHPTITREQATEAWNRISAGQSTMLAESRALGRKSNAGLRAALRVLLGADAFASGMKAAVAKRGERKPTAAA